MDKKTKRNIAIAVVFLVVLLIEPFWRPLMATIKGEDATSGSTPAGESIVCTVNLRASFVAWA